MAAGYNECCNSTSGNCTGSPPNCFCDPQCRIRGDCCSDIRDTCPSSCRAVGFDTCPYECIAAGRDNCCVSQLCPGQLNGLDICYCDPSCRRHGDCCDDIDIICPGRIFCRYINVKLSNFVKLITMCFMLFYSTVR